MQVALELRNQHAALCGRWERLFQEAKQYMQAGDLVRNWKDYRAGVEQLQAWLENAEAVLSTTQLTSTDNIKAYGQQLKVLNEEIEGIEELFKDVSRKFQTLIQDLSREEVDKMMSSLKKEKEALVRVRALIPMQLHLYHQILVQQESLEAGQREISGWLDEAERLLSSYDLSGGRDSVLSQLEKHKAFFSRIPYYKSMLESKNKVFSSMFNSVDGNKQQSSNKSSASLHELNERFVHVSQVAQSWEQRLQEAVRCWGKLRESERQISEWLLTAETLINDRDIDNRQSVEYHKNFFGKVNERWIEELVNIAQDLKGVLSTEQHAPVVENVNILQKRWKDVLTFAPLHLMKLEFRLDEATFLQYLKEIEKEINAEQQALVKNEDAGSILKRNKDFFLNHGMSDQVERSLLTLKKISSTYCNLKPDDTSLSRAVENADHEWRLISNRIDALKEQLRLVPQQWAVYKQK